MPKGKRNAPRVSAPTEIVPEAKMPEVVPQVIDDIVTAAIAEDAPLDETIPIASILSDEPAIESAPQDVPVEAVTNEVAEVASAESFVDSDLPAKEDLIDAQFDPAPLVPHLAAPIEELAVYASRIEREAQPLAVCKIIHPHAVDGTVFDGVFAGIRLEKGDDIRAQLSNGEYL